MRQTTPSTQHIVHSRLQRPPRNSDVPEVPLSAPVPHQQTGSSSQERRPANRKPAINYQSGLTRNHTHKGTISMKSRESSYQSHQRSGRRMADIPKPSDNAIMSIQIGREPDDLDQPTVQEILNQESDSSYMPANGQLRPAQRKSQQKFQSTFAREQADTRQTDSRMTNSRQADSRQADSRQVDSRQTDSRQQPNSRFAKPSPERLTSYASFKKAKGAKEPMRPSSAQFVQPPPLSKRQEEAKANKRARQSPSGHTQPQYIRKSEIQAPVESKNYMSQANYLATKPEFRVSGSAQTFHREDRYSALQKKDLREKQAPKHRKSGSRHSRSKSNKSLTQSSKSESQVAPKKFVRPCHAIMEMKVEKSTSRDRRKPNIETFGTTTAREPRVKTLPDDNKAIFANLRERSDVIQTQVHAYLKRVNQKLIEQMEAGDDESPDRVALMQSAFNTKEYPMVTEAHSFKEIATGLVKQFEYLLSNGVLAEATMNRASRSREQLQPDSLAKPKSILKNSQSPKRSLQQLEEGQNSSAVINLSQLKENQRKDEEIEGLKKHIHYITMQNQGWQKQIREMHEKAAKENDFFSTQVEGHHQEMEEYFQKVQRNHSQQLADQKKEMHQKLVEKASEQQELLDSIALCQKDISTLRQQLFDQKEEMKKQQQALKEDPKGIDSFLDLERKNMPELQAELNYARGTVQSLENEIKTMKVELDYYRRRNEEALMLQEQILSLEGVNSKMRADLDSLIPQKDYFEKEYEVQRAQIQSLNARLQDAMMGDGRTDLPMRSRSRERSNDRVPVHRPEPSSSKELHDLRMTLQTQTRLIEKLTIKLKKATQSQLNQDFSLFNLDRKENQFKEEYQVDLKTFKHTIQELYDILQTQSESTSLAKNADYEQQVATLKSYLNLQRQIGNLKKFRFDSKFYELIDLQTLQVIYDQFFSNDSQLNLNLGRTQGLSVAQAQIKSKQETFEALYRFAVAAVGEFFVIFQQMQHYKTQSKLFEANQEAYKLRAKSEHIGMAKDSDIITQAENRYDRALLGELEAENKRLMDELITLRSQVDLYKAESSLEQRGIFDFVIDAITSEKREEKQSGFSASAPKPPAKKQSQKKPKIFGSRKSWTGQDPDLNEAIDKIEQLEMDLDYMDKEKQVFQGEASQAQRDLEEMQEHLKVERETSKRLDQLRIANEEKLASQGDELQALQEEADESRAKIIRMTTLNQELQDLIEEEREVSSSELKRKDTAWTLKMQQIESKNMLMKNKLLKLATHLGAYTATSFNQEQIVDSIVDHILGKKADGPTYIPPPFHLDEDLTREPSRMEPPRMEPPRDYRHPVHMRQRRPEPEQPFRPPEVPPQSETTQGRSEHIRQTSQRSNRSKSNHRYEQIVSDYERDLNSIEKGTLKFNRFRSQAQDEGAVSKFNEQQAEIRQAEPSFQRPVVDQDEIGHSRKEEVFHSRDVNQQASRNLQKRHSDTEQAFLRMAITKEEDSGHHGHHNTVQEMNKVGNVTGSFNRPESNEQSSSMSQLNKDKMEFNMKLNQLKQKMNTGGPPTEENTRRNFEDACYPQAHFPRDSRDGRGSRGGDGTSRDSRRPAIPQDSSIHNGSQYDMVNKSAREAPRKISPSAQGVYSANGAVGLVHSRSSSFLNRVALTSPIPMTKCVSPRQDSSVERRLLEWEQERKE